MEVRPHGKKALVRVDNFTEHMILEFSLENAGRFRDRWKLARLDILHISYPEYIKFTIGQVATITETLILMEHNIELSGYTPAETLTETKTAMLDVLVDFVTQHPHNQG